MIDGVSFRSTAIAWRLTDPAASPSEHRLIQNGGLIMSLPVKRYQLDALAPHWNRIEIGGREADALGIDAHEIFL